MLRKQLGMTLWIGSLAWLSSCATGVQTMPNVPVDGRDTSGEVVGEDRRAALINQMPSPADEHVQRFCAEVASRAGGSSLGCLPLVSYWAQREAPEVTRLGEWFGDEVARGVSAAGFGGWVVDTNGMATLLADMNVERVSLHSLAAVSQRCERLGVDVVIFGSVRRYDNTGRDLISRLEIDLNAFDVLSKRNVHRTTFTLRGDIPANGKYWDFEKRPSTWQPGNEFKIPPAEISLASEIRVATRVLARRILASLDPGSVRGVVYVPPADTALYVRAVARLRGVQSAFAAELARRQNEARQEGAPVDFNQSVALNGLEFPNFQAANAYLETLRESLMTTASARFGMSVSAMLAEFLRPSLAPHEVRVNDVGFTQWSDTQLVEGALATGGLANSLLARRAMRDAGIEFVVAPRLENFGSNILLRVEVFDLEREKLAFASHFPFSARFENELAKELGIGEYGLERIEDLSKTEDRSWDSLYDKVSSGVTGIVGPGGVVGTGFVVSPVGHIMTNAHVVEALDKSPGAALLSDGSRQPFQVVMKDDFWDLAIVKIPELPSGTHIFQFADGSEVKPGMEVAVLGHPKDTSGWVITPGHISSTKEVIPTGKGQRPSYMYTCPTRVGNSGSPVLLLSGRVAAVNSHSLTGESGSGGGRAELTGFAFGAPGNEAARLFSSLGSRERPRR